MRSLFLLLPLLTATGCSYYTYRTGQHKNILRDGTPRSAVIAELGAPASSTNKPRSGERTDIYFTRARIPDWVKSSGYGEAAGMTFGFSEFFAAPYAFIDHNLPRQKRLILPYDSTNHLKRYYVENVRR